MNNSAFITWQVFEQVLVPIGQSWKQARIIQLESDAEYVKIELLDESSPSSMTISKQLLRKQVGFHFEEFKHGIDVEVITKCGNVNSLGDEDFIEIWEKGHLKILQNRFPYNEWVICLDDGRRRYGISEFDIRIPVGSRNNHRRLISDLSDSKEDSNMNDVNSEEETNVQLVIANSLNDPMLEESNVGPNNLHNTKAIKGFAHLLPDYFTPAGLLKLEFHRLICCCNVLKSTPDVNFIINETLNPLVLLDGLKCVICQITAVNVDAKCHKLCDAVVCNDCYKKGCNIYRTTRLKRLNQHSLNSCPNCKQAHSAYLPIDRFKRNVILSLKGSCSGCNEQLTREEYDVHYKDKCKASKCKLGCGFVLSGFNPLVQIAHIETDCIKLTVKCIDNDLCHWTGNIYQLKLHLEECDFIKFKKCQERKQLLLDSVTPFAI